MTFYSPPTKKFNTSCVRTPKLPATQLPLGGCSAGQLQRTIAQWGPDMEKLIIRKCPW